MDNDKTGIDLVRPPTTQKVEKSDEEWKAEILKEQPTDQPNSKTETTEEAPLSGLKKNDLTGYLSYHNGTIEEITAIFADKKLSPEQIKEQLNDPKSQMAKLLNTTGMYTKQFELMSDALKQINESQHKLSHNLVGLEDKITKGRKSGGGEITGKDARLSVIARTQGLKKVQLFNSGFHVMIRPFSLAELNEFFNTVDIENKELGRILGGHFHMLSDIFLKQKFMELFPVCVVSSNLKNWDKSGRLSRYIKLSDYDTLLWACCSLLFREGVNIELLCINPECDHSESELFIDLNNIRLNNFDLLPPKAIEFLMVGSEVTTKELDDYQTMLSFTTKIKIKDEIYHLRIPSIYEHLENGLSLIAKITSAVNGEASVLDEQVQSQMTIYLYQTQLPWVSKVEFLDEDGNIDFFVTDKDSIMEALNVNRHEKEKFYVELKHFILDTKITHICYAGIKCPVCGKAPTSELEDYLPVDVQLLFFYLSCQLLQLAGLNLMPM